MPYIWNHFSVLFYTGVFCLGHPLVLDVRKSRRVRGSPIAFTKAEHENQPFSGPSIVRNAHINVFGWIGQIRLQLWDTAGQAGVKATEHSPYLM